MFIGCVTEVERVDLNALDETGSAGQSKAASWGQAGSTDEDVV
jgi:hypothetical protein